jgi:hypothetical protein
MQLGELVWPDRKELQDYRGRSQRGHMWYYYQRVFPFSYLGIKGTDFSRVTGLSYSVLHPMMTLMHLFANISFLVTLISPFTQSFGYDRMAQFPSGGGSSGTYVAILIQNVAGHSLQAGGATSEHHR